MCGRSHGKPWPEHATMAVTTKTDQSDSDQSHSDIEGETAEARR